MAWEIYETKIYSKNLFKMKKFIQRVLRRNGYQITRYPDLDIRRRFKIIEYCDINKIFDIGANTGQYALNMRQLGYDEKIISFEPLEDAFQVLEDISSNDKNWIINKYALGNEDIDSYINVAGNSQSSSILEMLPEHIKSAPKSKYIAKQEIQIKKVDSIFDNFYKEGDHIMMKIDTQGYEKNVIDGAEKSLDKIRVIQLEMSIVPLYENELLFVDMIKYLGNRGFQLYSLESGFTDQSTGKLLQVDGIFVNNKIVKPGKHNF